MTATALQTFGVDAVELQSLLPQIGMEGTDDLLTTARISQIVDGAAARVCGVLVAAGLVPADIAADTASSAYARCRELIIHLSLPGVMRAVVGAAPADVIADRASAIADLDAIRDNAALLGFDSDTSIDPAAWTTTSAYADLADTNPVVYRRWADHDGDGPKW